MDGEIITSLDLMEESIMYSRLVNSRIIRTDVMMPRGEPSGSNVLLSIICDDLQATIDRIRTGKVIKLPPSYRQFVKPYTMTKTVFNRTKRFTADRKKLREFCTNNNLIYSPSVTSNRNTITDISDMVTTFLEYGKMRSLNDICEKFIPYLKSCLFTMPKAISQKNIILIDLNDYSFTRSSRPKYMKLNPLFILYRILKFDPELAKDFNCDIILMGSHQSMMVNPSTITAKELRQFYTNIFTLMNMSIEERAKFDAAVDKEFKSQQIKTMDPKTDNLQIGLSNDNNKASSDNDDKKNSSGSKLTSVIDGEDNEENNDSKKDDGEESGNSFNDIFDDDNIPTNSEEEPETTDSEDEIFVPDSEEDPFGDQSSAKKKRARVDRVRSRVIEPGSAKQKELLENQSKIVVRRDKTIDEEEKIIAGEIEVPTTSHEAELHSSNTDITTSRYENYRKTYMEQGFDSDMTKAFTSLNSKDNAFYIKDIKITDHSDSMNYLELWEVTLIDQYGTSTTVKLDIPKLYDNKYFLLGGNLKTLENQNVPLPIIKTGPNRVIITTNYNKIFMDRYSTKSITTISKLAKMISLDEEHKYFTTGTNTIDNREYSLPLAMDEIGKHITKFKSSKCSMYFNMKLSIMKKMNPDVHSKDIWIGKLSGEDIFINRETGKTKDGKTIVDVILENVPEEYVAAYNSVKLPKTNMYVKMKMNMKNVPCLYIICYWIGLQEVLDKSGVKYRFVPDEGTKGSGTKTEIRVKFSDGSLYYENSEFGELLLNPLLSLNTKDVGFNDMSVPETWEDILVDIYGSYKSLNVIKAFNEWMIDWITLEILQMYHLPETISELIIYGIKLLTNNQYIDEINDSTQRMRHGEVIPAMVYYRLASQYAKYVSTGGKAKMTLPQDAIIKDLLALTTLEDASIINPILEMSKDSSISKRGYRGTNLDKAYTRALRTYSQDSIGKIAATTATGPNVGVQKYLVHEPDIVNLRGIRENTTEVSDMSGPNVMSTTEMLIPMALMHDDATRVGMGVKQAGHVVPSEVSHPPLISNGADEAVRFRLSSEYVVNAEADGKVVEYDATSGMMVVQYKPYDAKPGKFRAFKLSPDVVKNSGGGIYFAKQMTTHLKVGDTFKKGDPLAYHDKFFTYSKNNGLCYNIGPLLRCVIYATSEAYEDGGWVTQDAAEMMSTSIVYQETAQLDRNANISDIKKIGDIIHVDDKLISFASGTTDKQLNKLLSMLDDDTSEDLQKGKKSSHAGELIDIVIYSQVDPEECSPSVKKLLDSYRSRVQRVGKILDKYDKSDGIVKAGYMNRQPEMNVESKYGKIKGVETDILIEFYIKHIYNLSIGDKIVLYSANKNTISKVIPNDMRGWSENNPDDPIQAGISPSPLSKRMISSIPVVLSNTTCMIELKRKILKIWNEK